MRLDSPEADLLFTALGNKTRRRMLQRLSEKPTRSISELARAFGISGTAASKHVAQLEQAGFIHKKPRGKFNQLTAAVEISGQTTDGKIQVLMVVAVSTHQSPPS